MITNALYSVEIALFVLNIFNFFPDFFGHVGKRIYKKAKPNLKICGVINRK